MARQNGPSVRLLEIGFMKKILKIIGICAATLVVAVIVLGLVFFAGLQKAGSGPPLGAGLEPVQDGMSTVYLLDAGNGQLVLVDAGNDVKGTAIQAALANRHATADNVAAILITHAHPDHDATIALFPKAEIYALKREVPLADGSESFQGPVLRLFGAHNTHPFRVSHPLDDGEKFAIGNLDVTAFAVPGHTPGSAAYLVSGVLFMGDSAQITSKQQLIGPNGLFSNDTSEGAASLKHLDQELQPRAAEIKFLSTAHTGNIAGLEPLNQFASATR